MTDRDDGGSAFPLPSARGPDGCPQYDDRPGMTLRDWFAGMAIQGLIASEGDGQYTLPLAAARAYELADAILKERGR